MRLLFLSTSWDEDYYDNFQRLTALTGHVVKKTTTPFENPLTLDVIAKKHDIDAIICNQASTLYAILKDQPDYTQLFNKNGAEKKPTLDQYAGSILKLRSGLEVLIINPLERLRTVPYEKFVLNRYITKLTKKSSWLTPTKFSWTMVTEKTKDHVLERIRTSRLCAIDIETPWPQLDRRIIDCVSYTVYRPETHTTESYVIPFEEVWHWEFVRAANATETPKVFQGGLFDNSYFLRWGCPVTSWFHDTYHFFHSWLSELPKDLGFIAAFSIRDARFWKDEGKTGKLEDRFRYCAKDGWGTINSLLQLMWEAPDFAFENYINHEFQLVFPSINAAMEGLDIDIERFRATAEKKAAEVEAIKTRLCYLLNEPNYNPGSPKQNLKVFELLGCGYLGGTGKIETQKAKAAHPVNDVILGMIEKYKKEAKQVGAYFNEDKLWNSRFLASFDPGGTDTLRAASRESAFDCGGNAQNIPRDDPAFKKCVVAPAGWYIAEVDKKQSEARCVAYLSGDPALLELVESSHDYHAWNASKFFGVDYAAIYEESTGTILDKALRDLSKRTNHGANYNMGEDVMLDTMGPKKVAQAKITLKLPQHYTLRRVCRYLLDCYEATYTVVKGKWYESIIQAITATKKLVSPFGWTRVFHGNPRYNKQHLNSAVAHAPQNLSVAIINREWYKIWRETVYGSLRGKVRIKAQIHDSLLFIYRSIEHAAQVQQMMDLRVNVTDCSGVTRSMYIPTDLSTGKVPSKYWSDLK